MENITTFGFINKKFSQKFTLALNIGGILSFESFSLQFLPFLQHFFAFLATEIQLQNICSTNIYYQMYFYFNCINIQHVKFNLKFYGSNDYCTCPGSSVGDSIDLLMSCTAVL